MTAGGAKLVGVVDLADTFLATTALADGRASDAEVLARGAADSAHAGGRKNDEAAALAALASALVAQKKLEDAAVALDRAGGIEPTRVEAQMELAIARAALLAASSGGAARAKQIVGDTLSRAQRMGFANVARDARRALARKK